jgi:hypothetical protein
VQPDCIWISVGSGWKRVGRSLGREACRAACECVEMLFHSAGAATAKRGDRLQRYFRDVQMYRIHIQSQAVVPVLRAQVHLGMELPLPFQPQGVRRPDGT